MSSHEEITSRLAEVCLREAPGNQKSALDVNELVAVLQNKFLAHKKTFESNVLSELGTMKSSEEAMKFIESGINAYRKGTIPEAISLFTESVAVAPNEPGILLAIAYGIRSVALHRFGKLIESLLDVNRALKGKLPKKERADLCKQKQICLNNMRTSTQFGATHYKRDETDPIRVKNPEEEALLDDMYNFEKNDFIPNASPKIKPEYNEQRGRHLVAVEDIEAGEILYRQKSFLCVESTFYKNCSYCLARCYALIPCLSCAYEMYCSIECRLQARKAYHEMECKMYRISRKPFPQAKSTAIRALLIGTKQGTELQNLMEKLNRNDIFAERIDPRNTPFADEYLSMLRVCRSFNSIQRWFGDTSVYAHIMTVLETIVQMRRIGFFDNTMNKNDDHRGTTSEDRFTVLPTRGSIIWTIIITQLDDNHCHLSKDACLNEVELFTAMLLLNHMVSLTTCICKFDVRHIIDDCESTNQPKTFRTVGFGVNNVHHWMNNSCFPNAHYVVKNRDQILFAKRPIKKGEQITLAHAGHFAHCSLQERLSELERFCLVCHCEACTNDWPGLETLSMNCNVDEFINRSRAMEDFNQQLVPFFTRIIDRSISDLFIDDILRFTFKIVQWINTHVKRPSLVLIKLEESVVMFMYYLFDESSRGFRNPSAMRKLFVDTVLRYLVNTDRDTNNFDPRILDKLVL